MPGQCRAFSRSSITAWYLAVVGIVHRRDPVVDRGGIVDEVAARRGYRRPPCRRAEHGDLRSYAATEALSRTAPRSARAVAKGCRYTSSGVRQYTPACLASRDARYTVGAIRNDVMEPWEVKHNSCGRPSNRSRKPHRPVRTLRTESSIGR